jgi:hypothetical protein
MSGHCGKVTFYEVIDLCFWSMMARSHLDHLGRHALGLARDPSHGHHLLQLAHSVVNRSYALLEIARDLFVPQTRVQPFLLGPDLISRGKVLRKNGTYFLLQKLEFLRFEELLRHALRVGLSAQAEIPQLFAELGCVLVQEARERDLEVFDVGLRLFSTGLRGRCTNSRISCLRGG